MRSDDVPPQPRSSPRRNRLDNSAGLVAEALAHGALTRLEASGTSLLMYPANPAEAGPANVHLRLLDGGTARHLALLGPAAPGRTTEVDGALVSTGVWGDLAYRLTLRLAADQVVWRWDLEVTHHGSEPVRIDAVLTHDPALAAPGAVRTNEYYVSQYLDISPVETPDHGVALAVRQNMPGPQAPWLLIGSARRGTGWATDAHQLVERTTEGVRWTGLDATDLPARRLQHEHALVALQDDPVDLAPGGTHRTAFVGIVLVDHPGATGPRDADHLTTALTACTALDGGPVPARPTTPTLPTTGAGARALLAAAATLPCRPLTTAEVDALGLTAEPGSVEHAADGAAVSWRTGHGEVVTAAKELAVLRPHGQILRTGDTLVPDTASLTSTVWMAGTFHSQVTRGHVGRDTLVSGRRSYLGLFRSHGVRLLVRDGADSDWRLLDTPSAWCAGLDTCRWWYATADGLLLEVVSRAPSDLHSLGLEVRVVAGRPQQLRATLHLEAGAPAPDDVGGGLALGDWRLTWAGDVRPALDSEWLLLDVPATSAWSLALAADTVPDERLDVDPGSGLGAAFWSDLTGALTLALPGDSSEAGEVAAIGAATPWFIHNALVHYLAPRGLEQFSGGAWGTRDACQGPVGLLTALDRHDEVRDVLLHVFRAQNARGDWPQAFEFLPLPPGSALFDGGQQDSHGDVVYWPLLAVGEHLQATGEAGLLEEKVSFVGDDGPTAPATVEEHLERALVRIEGMAVPGTPLPAYGHGDWNDSLQPADPGLARRLSSTWTAVLQVQALDALASGLATAATAPRLAGASRELAGRTRKAITGSMLLDGVLPGYLHFPPDGPAEPLVHPRDARTGLTYGILPWVHAVASDVLDPAAAREHLALIEEHLLGPDGARLFDRPVAYQGGPMSVFQRAEASTFWGREIGLMYVHAHLRYAEALARVGDGAGLLRALSLASPWGLDERVPQSRPRQRSCYYSSSDGAFTDRADASARYPDLMAGDVPLEGGWRIYSSGPGLALRLVVERLLGVRRRGDLVELDPVLPPGCDGLVGEVRIAGLPARLRYAVGPEGVGVRRLRAGGRELALTPLVNPHRRPGVAVRTTDLRAALAAGPDLLVETC